MPKAAPLLLALLAPLLAFPTRAPASYQEDTTTEAEAADFTRSYTEKAAAKIVDVSSSVKETTTEKRAFLGITAFNNEDFTIKTTRGMSISGSRGRSEYIEYDSLTEEYYLTDMSSEPSIISTEQYMFNRTLEHNINMNEKSVTGGPQGSSMSRKM